MAVKFEGGRGLQNSANLPSNSTCISIFLHKKAVQLIGGFYVVVYVYVLGFRQSSFLYASTIYVFLPKKLSFNNKREFHLKTGLYVIVYVYILGFRLSSAIYTSTKCVLILKECSSHEKNEFYM